MKKKQIALLMTGVLTVATLLAGCGGKEAEDPKEPDNSSTEQTEAPAETPAEAETPEEAPAETGSAFTPENTVTFNVSSKAGGNSDLITRTLTDICTKEGLVDVTFVVNNNTDGSGNIVRIETNESSDPDHTLLCFSSGDMQSLLDSDIGMTVKDFSPIATVAADKQLIFAKTGGKYDSFEKVLAAVEGGTKVNVGGTKSNEMTVFNMFAEEIEKTDMFNYMMYDSSNESITALLGDHIDLAMGSPAAAISYVESGDIVPIVALSDERFIAPLDGAPTMTELGYDVVQSPMWRGVLAPGSMSEEAQQFWNETFKKVTESEAWQEYLNKYLLSPYYNDLETSREIMLQSQEDYLAGK
ncbi:MAG: tripartite tricarboxylate transporter substrate binding protein [Lachnospiraceae bacterium]|nr:tripartite tricarboxylate transporter substrate binding protein [Lachnospiraceae bacterium]